MIEAGAAATHTSTEVHGLVIEAGAGAAGDERLLERLRGRADDPVRERECHLDKVCVSDQAI